MAVELLGFPTTLGMPYGQVRRSPDVLRASGLLDALNQTGTMSLDLGDMALAPGDRADSAPVRVQKVVDAARAQADFWCARHRADNLMLTLGGDHSTSLGTILALARMGHTFDVVWIDAHGDFNTLETSPSGNPHGMPLALACGLMPDFMPAAISPSALRLWGIRDLDAGERRLLEEQQVEVLGPDQIRHDWERAIRRLKPNILLSFDMDSLEPEDSPGTRTPVPGGLRSREALDLVTHIARSRKILALDIVEFHPDHDRENRTADLAVQVIRTAVAAQVERSRYEFGAAAGN